MGLIGEVVVSCAAAVLFIGFRDELGRLFVNESEIDIINAVRNATGKHYLQMDRLYVRLPQLCVLY